jgi:hypothetical protein
VLAIAKINGIEHRVLYPYRETSKETFISLPRLTRVDKLGVVCGEGSTETTSGSEKIFKGEDIKWIFSREDKGDTEIYFIFEGAYNLETGCDLIVIQSENGTIILSPPEQEIRGEERKVKREKKEKSEERKKIKKETKRKSKKKASSKRKKKKSE